MLVHDEDRQRQQQQQLHLQQQRRACKLLLSIKRLPDVGSPRFVKLQAVWAAMQRRGLTQQLPPHIAAMMATLEQQALKLRQQQQQCCNGHPVEAAVPTLQPEPSDAAKHAAAAAAGSGSRSDPDRIVIEVQASLSLTTAPSLAAVGDGAAVDAMHNITPDQLLYPQATGAAAATAAAGVDMLDALLLKPSTQQAMTSSAAAAAAAAPPAASTARNAPSSAVAAHCGGTSSSSSLGDTQQQWEALTSAMDAELSLLSDLWEDDDVSADQLDVDMCPAAALSADSLAGLDDSEALCR
jgi:hypothetical protein